MIRIYEYGKIPADRIFERQEYITGVTEPVKEIITNVRQSGDKAVFEYTEKFDKADISSLEVSEAEINEAFAAVDKEFLEILKEAAENIKAFHQKQVRNSFIISEKDGVVIGQKVTPIEKVGLYVPAERQLTPPPF